MQAAEIVPGVWHIEEDYRVYCTLVVGEERSILFDTGHGKGDLLSFVRAHTGGECLLVNSHGHSDHIGGNGAFPKCFLHHEDWPMLRAHCRMTTGGPPPYEVEDIQPGETFDLGGRLVRAVSLAGHTRGSVGLLLEGEGLLLAGDGLNLNLLLLGGEAAPISTLRETLQAAEKLPFDRYLASHAPNPLPKKQVGLHLRHLDQLRVEPPSHPGPYGPRVCRSQYKEKGGRSVILFDRGLAEEP